MAGLKSRVFEYVLGGEGRGGRRRQEGIEEKEGGTRSRSTSFPFLLLRLGRDKKGKRKKKKDN